MATLSSKQRKKVPKSEMGLPGKSTKKGGAVSGSYPMPDKKHAAVAKSFASRYASPAEKKKIDAKANAILNKGKKKKGK